MTIKNVTNNFTESFNAWVDDLRQMPILTMLEGLGRKIMKKLHKRFQKTCTSTTNVLPNIVQKLKDIAEKSR